MKKSLALVFILFACSTNVFSQDSIAVEPIAIDSITGIGKYQWGASLDDIGCPENPFGACNHYPERFWMGRFPIYRIESVVSKKRGGLYQVQIFFKNRDAEQIIAQTKEMYGEPTSMTNTGMEWQSAKNKVWLSSYNAGADSFVSITYKKLIE